VRKETAKKVIEAQELVVGGVPIKAACKRVGLSQNTFYKNRDAIMSAPSAGVPVVRDSDWRDFFAETIITSRAPTRAKVNLIKAIYTE
jgi:hypothetical protein